MSEVIADEIDSGYHEAPRELTDVVRKCIVPLVMKQDGKIVSIGTGTIISSWGAILTAGHVLQAAIKAGRPRAKDGHRYQEYELYALVRTYESHPDIEDTELGGLVPITNIWTAENLDVGFCAMSAMTNVQTNEQLSYNHMPLNFKPPLLGQRCFAMGFPEAEGSTTDGINYDYSEKLYSTDGEIIEVHRQGRDPVVLPYPSFTVEGLFEHNMSGGPVFLDGEVGISGIITRGLDTTRAYASMVWPGMGIATDLQGDLPKTILEAVQQNFIPTVDNGYSGSLSIGEDGRTQIKLISPPNK